MDLKLAGRTALVTGASRGIGLAVAKTLGAEGCHLHLAARSEEGLRHAADEIAASHSVEVTIHPCDLSLPDAVTGLGEACADVDILVNNAGDIPTGTLESIDSATWRQGWDSLPGRFLWCIPRPAVLMDSFARSPGGGRSESAQAAVAADAQ